MFQTMWVIPPSDGMVWIMSILYFVSVYNAMFAQKLLKKANLLEVVRTAKGCSKRQKNATKLLSTIETGRRPNERTSERMNEVTNNGCCLCRANLTIVLHIGKSLFFHDSPSRVSFFLFIFMSSSSAKENNTLIGMRL